MFLHGDVGHAFDGRRSVPVFHARRRPDHVAGAYFLLRAAPLLHPSGAGPFVWLVKGKMGLACAGEKGCESTWAG
jgi:hypothetical protein